MKPKAIWFCPECGARFELPLMPKGFRPHCKTCQQQRQRILELVVLRRMRACVLACAGVPTEALEAFARRDVFGTLWRDEWEAAFNQGAHEAAQSPQEEVR